MKPPVDKSASGYGGASDLEVAPGVDQITTYRQFLAKALALGTEESLRAKSERRKQLLKILRPVDLLTRTGAGIRAGALALAASPLICAAPYIYSRFGFDAVAFNTFLPAVLLTAVLFWIVKALQKSKWHAIEAGTEDAAELERTVKQLDETRLLQEAIVRTGRSLYRADLILLKAYNQRRASEGKRLSED